MNEIRFRAQTPKEEAKDLRLRLQVVLGDMHEVVLETKSVASMSGYVGEEYYIVIKKSTKDRIKEFVKELFDSGMTLDEIIETVASAAMTEDFKRGVSHGLK